MAKTHEAPGERLRALWGRLAPLPGGRWLFSRIMGGIVPYTNSIRATVLTFEPGQARVHLPDRRRIRNHLRSIHAIALANVGELSTGLALIGALGTESRAILTGIDVEYSKKARGPLVAEAHCTPPPAGASVDLPVVGVIRDAAGDTVATVTARWRVGPARKSA